MSKINDLQSWYALLTEIKIETEEELARLGRAERADRVRGGLAQLARERRLESLKDRLRQIAEGASWAPAGDLHEVVRMRGVRPFPGSTGDIFDGRPGLLATERWIKDLETDQAKAAGTYRHGE